MNQNDEPTVCIRCGRFAMDHAPVDNDHPFKPFPSLNPARIKLHGHAAEMGPDEFKNQVNLGISNSRDLVPAISENTLEDMKKVQDHIAGLKKAIRELQCQEFGAHTVFESLFRNLNLEEQKQLRERSKKFKVSVPASISGKVANGSKKSAPPKPPSKEKLIKVFMDTGKTLEEAEELIKGMGV